MNVSIFFWTSIKHCSRENSKSVLIGWIQVQLRCGSWSASVHRCMKQTIDVNSSLIVSPNVQFTCSGEHNGARAFWKLHYKMKYYAGSNHAVCMYLARKTRHWAQFTSYYLPSQRASTFVQIHIIQFDKNFSIVKVNRFQTKV